MSKRLILILALAFVVGITFAAYAEVQNVKVSGDITAEGVLRNNLTLRKNNVAPATYNEFDPRISGMLSHVRVRIDADLTDNVSTTVRLLNERVWGQETNTADDTDIDLDLAYVALKEFLYSPLSLTIGRQELQFGNGLIIGDVDTNAIMAGHAAGAAAPSGKTTASGLTLPNSLDDLSVRKAFDAVRATLNYDPLVVDAVYAKIDENAIDNKDDINLYGVNANYALDKNTTVEGYYWERVRVAADAARASGNTGQQKRNDITRSIGARAQYSGLKNLSVGLEGAYQFGTHLKNTTLYPDEASNDNSIRRRRAYAIQATAQYNLTDLIKQYQPVISGSYTYLSGDRPRSTKRRYQGWDPMYENQAGGTLYNKILAYTNLQVINATGSIKPMEDVKLSLAYNYLRLNKAYPEATNATTFFNLSGVAGDPTYYMTNKKTLGHEFDTLLTYDYTEDVQFGLNLGWFFPGGAFNKDVNQARNNHETATQVIGSMKVTF